MDSLRERVSVAWRVLREGVPLAGDYGEMDEEGFRRITSSRRDLNPLALERAQAVSFKLWRENPMARRIIEMIVDFVVGDGLRIEAPDERVLQVVEAEFWNDRSLRLDLRHRGFVRDLSINGEIAFRGFVNDTIGRTRIGYIDPARIKDVRKHPDNLLIDHSIVLRGPLAAADVEVLIVNVDESDPSAPQLVGDAFYYGINRPTIAHRGTPDLLALADWIDGYDQTLWNLVERSGFQNAFIYDVTLDGASALEIDDWLRKHGNAPRPGTVRAHGSSEKWEAVSPALGAAETVPAARTIKNYALGGAGVPEAWFADGDSANRATLSAQGDPTYRMLTARQAEVRYVFEDILAWVVDRAIFHGRLPDGVDRTLRIITPEPSTKDLTAITGSLAQLTAAIEAAVEADLISKASARKVWLGLASQIGLELDPEEEEEAIAEEKKADEEADVPPVRTPELDALTAIGLDPVAPARPIDDLAAQVPAAAGT